MATLNKANPSGSKAKNGDDEQAYESHSSDNDFQDDDDDEDDDDNDRTGPMGAPIKIRGGSLQHASMTESYSEILNSPTGSGDEGATGPYPIPKRRPGSLPTIEKNSSFPQGIVSLGDGNMMHFVADNLEHKIKVASPNTKRDIEVAGRLHSLDQSEGKSLIQRQFLSSIPQIDPNVLNDIELEAQYLASNIDNLTENLCNLVHSISSIAADNVETYKTAVNKLTDCMDANIKTMYTIMAKTEEISNSYKTMEGLATRIKELKRMVDMLDNIV